MTDSNKGLRILIVEDNPGDLHLITELLNASVIKIQSLCSSTSIAEAVSFLHKNEFDIILLDLSVTDSSGIETFKSIKKSADKIPVIILSGLVDMSIAVEAISLGAQDYHLKEDLNQWMLTKTILNSIDRKRNLEELRQSNERYITVSKAELDFMQSEEITRKIMNASLDAIICIDTYGKITVWNPQAEKIFGWKQNEILGKSLTETIIPIQYRERHEKGMKHFAKTGEGPILNNLIELSAINRKGEQFPIELAVAPLVETGNQFFCAFIRDISERKKTEIELQQSYAQAEDALLTQKAILNSLLSHIIVLDSNGIIVEVNKAWQQFGGSNQLIDKKYCAGDNYIEIAGRATGQKKQTGKIVANAIKDIIAGNIEQFSMEYPSYLSEQEEWYSVNITRLNEKKIGGVVVSHSNISAIKLAEIQLQQTNEKYASLVNSVDGIVWEADAQTFEFSFVSKQAERLLGYPTQMWIESASFWANHMHPDDREQAVHYCQSCTLDKKSHEFEYRMIAADGSIVWLHDIVTVVVENGLPVKLRGIMIDITQKRNADELILKANARFQFISKATSDIVWDWEISDEPDVDKGWYNDNYYKILGIEKKKEFMWTREWYSRVHPDDFGKVKESLEKALAGTETQWREEYRYAKADGTYLHFFDRGLIMRNSDGKAYRIIGSMVDMTAIYQAQNEVAESENRLRTIFDSEPECIKLVGKKGELLDMNPAGLAMIEADNLEQVKGKLIINIVTPEYQKQFAELSDLVFEGKSGKLEFEIQGLKGRSRWVETNAVPFRNTNGEIISLLGITRDITEKRKIEIALRQNEEKYRTLVEQAADAIALYDASGKLLDTNTGATNLLGYTKGELVGMHLNEILTDDELKINPVRYDVLQQGISTIKQRGMRKKDGSIVETEVRSQQLPDGRFLSVIRDLTERIEKERELTASYESIRKLTGHIQNIREEERTHIAREIHDELGQQLTVLKMDVSWVRKKVGSSDQLLQDKLNDLIIMLDETVKSVRRISSDLRPSILDDLGLVAAMEWQLGEFEKRSSINTGFIHSGDDLQLPDSIRTALFRVFQESLTNIVRHSEAEFVTVSITIEDSNLILSISDNGKGFDMHKAAEKKTLGILGMKERITMVGGEYKIESLLDKGTEVIVQIPLDMI